MTGLEHSKITISPSELRELSAKSNWPGLVRLGVHVAALVVGCYAIHVSLGTYWVLPIMFVHGVQIAFLFNLHHECIHLTCFKSSWINRTVNWIVGLIVFYPPEYFQHFHLTHHRYTQDPDKDPELSSKPPQSRLQYWWWVLGIPYWERRLGTSLRHAALGVVDQQFVPERRHRAIIREARIVWAIYLAAIALSAAVQSWAIVYFWLAPIALGQPVLRLYQLAEHGDTEFTSVPTKNSRTTISNFIVRWIAWNMPYHTEHHLYPGVPFHALPRLHRLVQGKLENLSSGYVAVNVSIYSKLSLRAKRAIVNSGGESNG